MASLNTLKTKFGFIISGLIAVVLVVFVLNLDQNSFRDQPTQEEMAGQTVLTIDETKVSQLEYAEYKQKASESPIVQYYMMMYGMREIDPNIIASLAYENVMFDKYLNPAYAAAGLGYNAEDEAAVRDIFTKQYIANLPGVSEMSTEDIANAINAEWNSMVASDGIAAMITKANAINAYAAGKYANSLEINESLRNANLTFDGHYVMLPYSAITCEEPTAEEIEAYYTANRQENANYGARTLSYVRFNITASEADKANAEAAVMKADAEAKTATDSKSLKEALRSVNGKIANYVAISSLSEDEAKAIKAGENYGPVLNNNTWTAKYIVSKVSAPESYTFSAIVAESNTEAEALVEEIKAANGNLAEIEAGANATTATIKMVELNERGAEKFVNAKVGDVFTYNYQNKPAAIVITELGKKDNFVLTANVNLEVVASPETHSEVDAKVKMLMNKAGKTPEAFAAAVQEMGTFAIPTIVKRDADAHRVNPVVTGIEDSRNIAVWAYDAKVGDKKSWSAKNVTYVCMITDINDEKYEAKNEAAIKRTLENQKKFNAVKETLAMDSKVEGIKNGKFEGVSFGSDFVGEMADAVVATAIARSTKVGEPTIVKGNTGVCLFVVDNINNNEAVVNADVVAKRKEITEARKVDIRTNLENYLLDGVKVVDKRGISEL
jgi:peptidyl-prolyl cis-trans isomerase D